MTASIDQQFIEFIVKSLVGNPDAVSISRTIDEKGVLLELTVDQEDLGRVIGKRGATAQSLRTLLRALGTKNDARYNLKIVDVGGPMGERSDRNDERSQESSSQPKQQAQNDDDSSVARDEPEAETEKESDVLTKTRAELDDLDDLDI